MDAYIQPEIEWIIVRKSARIGWTSILGHVIGYHIDQNPCSQLMVQPTIDDASNWSKEDLQPVIEETPVLTGKVSEAKTRDSKSTITKKHYPGGILHVVGANSARGFRRISTRVVNLDEVDGYPLTAGQEGDQVQLAAKRADDYWDRKIGIGSTPTTEHYSRIESELEGASQGHFVLQCPECDGHHIRLFREPEKPFLIRGVEMPVSFIQWPDGQPEDAAWLCPECGGLIGYKHHRNMIRAGYWYGEHWSWRKGEGFIFEPGFNRKIGFSIWSGYGSSPNTTPAKLAEEFLSARKDEEKLKTFINTALGEVWKERGDTIDEDSLQARAEVYAAEVPFGALLLTAGIDVQGGDNARIEIEVVGWSDKEESWNIDYIVMPGDFSDQGFRDEVREELEHLSYTHESGRKLSLAGICIDSGYLATKVKAFCDEYRSDRIWPIKGVFGYSRPVIEGRAARSMRQRKRRKLNPVEIIGVDEAKTILFRRLKIKEPGPGYCHFPVERDAEYFAQFVAEKCVQRYKKGRPVPEWIKIRERNEALDNRNYAYAALLLLKPAWEPIKKQFNVPDAVKTEKPKPLAQHYEAPQLCE